MKAFVTGGSGFIGQHVVRKLIERGYEVHTLARSKQSADILHAMGATAVLGDITDTASMRDGMEGSDVVFHIAGWYEIGSQKGGQAEGINVGGTRRVLRLANELNIPKIVYTSTVAVFGDTHGQLVDETYYNEDPFLTEYDRTKWLAHYKVAQPLIEKGVPIVIVQPGVVYGPGDTGIVAQLMRMFYRGMPTLIGPDTVLTYAHVEDIAEGHILAAEKGDTGESYILAGPAIPLGEMIDFWGHLLGKRSPAIRVSGRYLRPFAPLMDFFYNLIPNTPALFSGEAVGSLGVTYMARSDKARNELGWKTRPLQTGMLETFKWIAETEPEPSPVQSKEKQLALLALITATVIFLFWLLGRRRK